MSNFNQIFSEIFAHREVVEKLSGNLSEQEQHEREERLNKIGKKSPRSSASVDELPLNFLEFSFAVSKIIIIFVA